MMKKHIVPEVVLQVMKAEWGGKPVRLWKTACTTTKETIGQEWRKIYWCVQQKTYRCTVE